MFGTREREEDWKLHSYFAKIVIYDNEYDY